MKLKEWIRAVETIAPPELALDYDNPGLLISPRTEDIRTVLVALDCTPETAREAVELGVDLMLTHHPVFFHAVHHILRDDPETAAAWILLQNGIGLYAAHTNWDAAEGGVNDVLLEKLGVRGSTPLPPDNLGRIGSLDMPLSLRDFAAVVETRLKTKADISGNPDALIQRVACIGGAGGDDISAALDAGADVFVTGEMKHHQGIAAEVLSIPVIVAGHYATEHPSLPFLVKHLQPLTNDILYKLALSDKGPFWHR